MIQTFRSAMAWLRYFTGAPANVSGTIAALLVWEALMMVVGCGSVLIARYFY